MARLDSTFLELDGALKLLLDEKTSSEDYSHKSFLDSSFVFLEALCGTLGGAAILDEHGSFVERETSSGEYERVWREGVDAALTIEPEADFPVHGVDASGAETVHVASDNLLSDLRENTPRARWEHHLESLCETIDAVHGRSSLKHQRPALGAWWDAANRLLSQSRLIHADGCRMLMGMRREGLDSFGSAFLSVRGWKHAEEVQGAASVLVRKVKSRPTENVPRAIEAQRELRAEREREEQVLQAVYERAEKLREVWSRLEHFNRERFHRETGKDPGHSAFPMPDAPRDYWLAKADRLIQIGEVIRDDEHLSAVLDQMTGDEWMESAVDILQEAMRGQREKVADWLAEIPTDGTTDPAFEPSRQVNMWLHWKLRDTLIDADRKLGQSEQMSRPKIAEKIEETDQEQKLGRGRRANPERDRRILEAVESGLYTMAQIGQQFGGITRSAISKAAKRARERRNSC